LIGSGRPLSPPEEKGLASWAGFGEFKREMSADKAFVEGDILVGMLSKIVAALQLNLPFFDAPPTVKLGERSAWLDGRQVVYQLKRSKRKTIGFVIDERGLTVSAPRWLTLKELETALQDKARWINLKLIEWGRFQQLQLQSAVRWEHGGDIKFMGQVLKIELNPSVQGVRLEEGVLLVGLSAASSAEQIKDRVHGWLQAQAKVYFGQRIHHYAQLLGKSPSRWGLSSARTRWGSCGADGAVRLNWRLVHHQTDLIDYVIAHELAHLKELNHGPRFWKTVEELFPAYQQARGRLKEIREPS
jgi:predicted metal-dependent hydrolase